MVSLNGILNYTNSFRDTDDSTTKEFLEYKVIEDDDESGKIRYRYRRVNLIKNTDIKEGKAFHYTFHQTREVIDLGKFDNWLHDVIRSNHQRFIFPHTDIEQLSWMMGIIPPYMGKTRIAYLVRVALPFKEYNLGYSAYEFWCGVTRELGSTYCRKVPTVPFFSNFRQTGKSSISKLITESMAKWHSEAREIPVAVTLTDNDKN